jgi:hypothetical protein
MIFTQKIAVLAAAGLAAAAPVVEKRAGVTDGQSIASPHWNI